MEANKKRRSSLEKAFEGPAKIEMNELITREKIGSGQYSIVFKGLCRGNNVAIKEPLHKKMTKAEFLLFLHEIEILKHVHHPNIVMLLGTCHNEEDDKIYIVTELLEGNLQTLKQGPYKLSTRLDWCYQAACGVSWLHQSCPPLIHRNLKASNLLYDQNMKIKVSDFGVSQFLPEGEDYVATELRGTPLFMAPEVIVRKEVGACSDVYSFAITMWEILTGEESFGEYKHFHQLKEEVLTRGKRPQLPEIWPNELKELITRMWDFDPERRPSFPSIVSTLKNLLEPMKVEEYMEELRTNIDDEGGVHFWKDNFCPHLEVEWDEFIETLYQFLGQPLPHDPSNFGCNPSPSQIPSASTSLLLRLDKKGVKGVKDEIRKRRTPRFDSSGQMYLVDEFSDQLNEEAQCTLICLKKLLSEKGLVNARAFGNLLLFFGPPSPCFLKNVTDLLRKEYFHGYLDGKQAAVLLAHKPCGTFLVRFSPGRRQVAISLVEANVIKHLVLQHVGGKGFRLNKSLENYWKKVDCFVDDYIEKKQKYNLQFPCPGSPFAHLFVKFEHPNL